MAALIRNYRFLIGAFAAVMLILLLRSSSRETTIDIARNVASSATRPSVPPEDTKETQFKTLPISNEPGYVTDSKTDSKNPKVADAVKLTSSSSASSSSSSSSGSKCTKDHSFVIMIDAGSTGSRIHVYEFDTCTQPPTLINETFEMLKPGLSSFDTDAEGAAKSLDPLLEKALEAVPQDKRSCTPVAVKATAGLRLLGEAKSSKILQAVRSHLENDYPFPVVEGSAGIEIMSGDDEGVYAWITTNYLLGNIGTGSKIPTTAVFDLGGGSTQIVFEPTFPGEEKMIDGEHKYDLNFGGYDYTLYQFSHLGYGLMQGRNKINSILLESALKKGSIVEGDFKSKNNKISTPCLPPNVNATDVEVKLGDSTYIIDFIGPKVPAGAQCRFLADHILNKDAKCSNPPCSFNGVHQPSLVRTFKETNDLYIFSYFYDRTRPLGMPLSFTLNELVDLARLVCDSQQTWNSVLSGIDGSLEELEKDPYFCLDLSFQVSLLHTGYDIPLHRELKTAQTIAGNELGWCLGASLPLLESDNWKCKVKQIN
ncbi:guanosine diphosphatase NDAI_0G00280 [Naumovozyma dairenensis CBS 421]|uniref:Guanosine-diphosphatase n=1 Tax=Naumovozyma dairenensis (strain ATCC 10597 / BCRC 20456 / CBS 421 / NBRC 0211 / NRRL Y-12639) TaxID=1071378 RepID=G0WDE3_NAUDC|nr:hypothetical protein NDAI_0G00280 [Naumovozyma dairenensis CBS 421]CCD25804.2 hypothetical protein NDAI_0G00280 [Naumovozyma dairenensis CBS 421]